MSDDKGLNEHAGEVADDVKHTKIGDALQGAKDGIGNAFNAMKEKFEGTDAHDKMSEGADNVKETAEKVGDKMNEGADNVKETAEKVGDTTFGEAAQGAKDAAVDTKDAVADKISEIQK